MVRGRTRLKAPRHRCTAAVPGHVKIRMSRIGHFVCDQATHWSWSLAHQNEFLPRKVTPTWRSTMSSVGLCLSLWRSCHDCQGMVILWKVCSGLILSLCVLIICFCVAAGCKAGCSWSLCGVSVFRGAESRSTNQVSIKMVKLYWTIEYNTLSVQSISTSKFFWRVELFQIIFYKYIKVFLESGPWDPKNLEGSWNVYWHCVLWNVKHV